MCGAGQCVLAAPAVFDQDEEEGLVGSGLRETDERASLPAVGAAASPGCDNLPTVARTPREGSGGKVSTPGRGVAGAQRRTPLT